MAIFNEFPQTNFHELNQDWILSKMKELIAEWVAYKTQMDSDWANYQTTMNDAWDSYQNNMNADWAAYKENLNNEWDDLKDFVTNYFDNLDVQAEVNTKLEQMKESGEIMTIIRPLVTGEAAAWIQQHASDWSGVVDNSLSIVGAAADAYQTGVMVKSLNKDLNLLADNFKEYWTSNRFNIDEILQGAYLSDAGIPIANANWITSGFCDIGGFSEVMVTCFYNAGGYRAEYNAGFPCFYDENKEFVSYVGNIITYPCEVPAAAKYFRFCYRVDHDISQLAVIEGSDHHVPYEPFEHYYYLEPTDTLYFNSVDIQPLESGYLLNGDNGTLQPSTTESYKVTDYIPIPGNNELTISTQMFFGWALYCFYDSEQNFIKGVKSATGGDITKLINIRITPPDNAAYIRIGFLYNADMRTPSLAIGETQSAKLSEIWGNFKWCAVGDSLTEKNNKSEIFYHELISNFTGINVVNMGVSGTGYAAGEGENKAFYQRVSEIPTDSDVITIFGSFNDIATGKPIGNINDTDTNTLAGCINTTIDNIYNRIPLAKLAILIPCPWYGFNPYNGAAAGNNYVNMLLAICNKRGIPAVDLYHTSGLRPWDETFRQLVYDKDNYGGTHPNEIGHEMLAAPILEELKKIIMY